MKRFLMLGLALVGLAAVVPGASAGSLASVGDGSVGADRAVASAGAVEVVASLGSDVERRVTAPPTSQRTPTTSCNGMVRRSCRSVG